MGTIKSQLVAFGGPIGGYQLCRFLTQSTPKILMYHRFSEAPKPGYVHREAFECQVDYLKKNFNLMTLDELITIYRQQGFFPRNAVVITVDDGYRDFYEIAFPVLKKQNAAATFFVTTKFIDGNFWLWPDVVKYILENSSMIDLGKMPGGFVFSKKGITQGDRQTLWNQLIVYLLSITEDEKVEWISGFSELQSIKLPDKPLDAYSAVNWSQVNELSRNSIEIGVHTQSHPSLGRLKESQLSSEINGAVDIITEKLGHSPKSFCFPNGQPSDYTELAKWHVESSGCQSAVTAFFDKNISKDLFEIRRFSISDNWLEFAKCANGVSLLMAQWFGDNNIIHGNAEPS